METKPDALRRVILMLCDGAYRQWVSDLLDALEQDIGSATITYLERIAQIAADDAGSAWGGPNMHSNRTIAKGAADRVVRSIRMTDWDRAAVLSVLPGHTEGAQAAPPPPPILCSRCGAVLNNVSPGWSVIGAGETVCWPCADGAAKILRARGM